MSMANKTGHGGEGHHRERLRVRGIVPPSEEWAEFWIEDGRLTTEPLPGATTVVDGGWLLPGLVDAHTHPGALRPGDPLDPALLQRHGPPADGPGAHVHRLGDLRAGRPLLRVRPVP
jgi:hypothetical protein